MTESTTDPSAIPPYIAGLHVLLVDDDQVSLKILHAMLLKLGVKQVTIADNGSDAFNKLVRMPKVVDCVLCDYSMHAGNGLQLLQSIRKGEIRVVRPDTCFILVTASRDGAVVQAARALDVNGYLVKPVTSEHLLAAIVKGRGRPVRVDFARYANVQVPQN